MDRKGGKGDRGARVGKTDRRNYDVGWRAHAATSMSALPLTYVVRSANVNDKKPVEPLLGNRAVCLAVLESASAMSLQTGSIIQPRSLLQYGSEKRNQSFLIRLALRIR